MTDGRVYTMEDEIDVLHEDLGVERRRLETMMRAPFESRVTDPGEHELAVQRQLATIRSLERALSDALAAQRAADEAYERDSAA